MTALECRDAQDAKRDIQVKPFTKRELGCGDDCMDAGGRATHGAVAEARTASIEESADDAVRKLTTSYTLCPGLLRSYRKLT
jgi:hypothetical protein